MNPLLVALVNSGIVDRSTADLVDRQTNPLEAQLYAEQVLQQAMRSGLLAQQIRYIDLVNAAQGKPSEEQLALFWQDENEALFRDIEGALVQVASDRAVQIGIAMGGDEMWAVVNEQVIDWVGDYYQSFDPSFVGSVPNLNVTARTIVGQATNEWQRGELEGAGEADGLPQLIRALEPAFGAQRADRISVTEVTRIFSEATIAAGQANPLITRYRWYSAADDRVCFPADTLVETGRGGKPIQDVRIGDSVLTRKGVRRVLAVSERKYNGAMVTVDTSVGSVTATAEHPFWTLEQGWLEGHNLNIGHTLQTFGKQDVQVLGVLNFDIRDSANTETVYHNRSNDAIMVYNLEVEDVPEFYANGILVHNCPICGPLHNQLSSANKSAPAWQHPTLGVVNIPPAHVNCRCQPVPETEVTLQFESDLPRPYTWSPETPTEYAKRRRDELNAERR